ncbi:MAG: SCP2 sterol-binding domain-containing protein [Deltaproteobacteria bacterium]|nr:SCP2 sterol-binding domain-containing protein [Deltaproteobacteria bacterium]
MATFENSAKLIEVLSGFFQFLSQDPGIGPKLLASRLILRFNYKEPEASLTVDLSGPQVVILANDTERKPEVEMSMKADVAHRFWLGQVNLMIALTRREITAKGPIPKILKLLPIIKPAYTLYPRYLEERGFFK